ncbi:MAG: hypothetical protein H0V17_28070, partial [Deltaproteobacteria bacterium]|nr:hypothetical protein [Deltaproteobacteria bacterium]
MTSKPPPGKGGKPFLGEDDLMSELDAWDATFDALHETAPANELAAAPPPPMEWPEAVPEVIDPTTLSRPAPMTSYDEPDEDFQTLDGSLELPSEDGSDTIDTFARAKSVTAQPIDPDPLETDFSGVGASGRPQTLGDILGATTDQISLPDDDRLEKARAFSRQRAVTPNPADDDEVFTSASRPTRAPADPNHKDDDDVAPPPVPEQRRTAAIVRRVTAPRASSNRDLTPAAGIAVAQFAEQTRVIHTDEIEARAAASKQSMPAMPIDDDAYDDIEIDSKPDESEVDVEVAPSQRRTAHVVRRTDTPTRPPPMRPTPGPVIEMEMGDETPIPKPDVFPGSENDFSDVAAAVGAGGDPLGDLRFELEEPKSAARTAPPSPPPGRKTPPPLRAVTPPPMLDLSDLDDGGPKTMIGAPRPDDLARARSPSEPPPFHDEDSPAMRMMIAAPGDELMRASRRHAVPDLSERDEDPEPLRTMIATPRPEDLQRLREGEQSSRPPALADFYPRVKTPTSVPPLGVMEEIERSGSMAGVAGFPGAGFPGAGGPGAGAPRAVGRISTLPPMQQSGVEREPVLDLDQLARGWPEQAPPLGTSVLDESAAAALLVYEREVATLDDSATSAALRIEAGRLCERLSDLERARVHYDAALLADPRATG